MTPGKVDFAAIQRVLALFTEAIAGRPLHLKPLDERSSNGYISRIATDGQSIHIPQSIADFAVPRHNFGAYRVIVLHQIGYLENGTFAFDLQAASTRMKLPAALLAALAINKPFGNVDALAPPKPLYSRHQLALPPTRPVSALERFFAAWRRPDLMRVVFVSIEDLRIDTILRRRYPGVRADLERVLAHALAGRPNIRLLRPLAGLVECLIQFSLGADRTALLTGDGTKLRAPLLDAAAPITIDGASVYDSARIAVAIYHQLEALIRRQRQRRLRERIAADGSDLDDAQEAQEAYEADAPPEAGNADSEVEDVQAADEDIAGSGIEFRGELMPDLVHRQLGGGQVGMSQSPDALKSETFETASKPVNGQDGSSRKPNPARAAASKRGLPDGPRSYLYDEWDYLAGAYQSAWCRLYEHQLRGSGSGSDRNSGGGGDSEFIAGVRRRHARLAQQIKRQFSLIKPESWQRVHRTSDGDELGLDSLIEAVIDRRAGQATDEHLYVRRDRALREVAAAFLVDMSASTDFPVPDQLATPVAGTRASTSSSASPSVSPTTAPVTSPTDTGPYLYGGYDDLLLTAPTVPKRRVIDVAKESLALMCDALHTLGDSYAVYGFSGEGRDNVEFHVAKDFDDRLSARTWGALAAMQPRRSTRMGPAIRHAAAKLARQPMRLKVLIIISDGYPQDSDYGPNRSDDEYGIQDTARALQEAERAGISTFCITIDPAGHDYLRRMCSENRYLVIDDVRSLPDELTKVYRALTA